MVAAAWYAGTLRSAATRNGRMPSDTARRSTVGGPVDRAPRAGETRDTRARPTAATAAGAARRSRRRAARRCSLSSSSSGQAPERWTTSAPGSQARAPARAAASAIAASGVATTTRSAPRPASATSRASARRGGRPRPRVEARVAGSTGDRDRRPPARRRAPTATVVPARPGPTRAKRPLCVDRARATSTFLALRSSPWCGCRSTRAAVNARPVGRTACLRRRGIRVRQRGSRSARGTSTNARSAIRGCGTTRSGSSTRSSPTRSTSTSSVRGPQRSPCAPARRGLEALSRARAAHAGVERGVDRHHRVQVVGLLGPADRRRSRSTGDTATTRRRRRPRRVRRPRAGGTRAGRRGSSRSRGTRDASARAGRHCSMHTATWSTIARTGGCSLRTVTATRGDPLVDAAHLGDAGRQALEQVVALGLHDAADRLGDRRVVDGVVERVGLARRR